MRTNTGDLPRQAIKVLLKKLRLLGPTKAALKLLTPRSVTKARKRRRKEKEAASLYAQFVSPGSVCFDVGANVGRRVRVFLALGARVIAVEPQADCVRALQRAHGRSRDVVILPVGLADKEGKRELLVSSDIETSSMSSEWVEAVRGRLPRYTWQATRTVSVTTLDSLIAEYGTPDFCKIDVEGFEYEVLMGLSQPIPALSFEYTPERIETALRCVARLELLGVYEFNLSSAETFRMQSEAWTSAPGIVEVLRLQQRSDASGDVYARLGSLGPGS